ncbi:MAG: nucleoside 2-deoxyribosyltransferase [Myxococcales bacterium]
MALTVFFVPSVRSEERDAIWQLQLLGQGYGFAVNSAERTKTIQISNADRARIRDSDAVIAIVTRPLDAHAKAELGFARQLKRPILALVDHSLRPSGLSDEIKVMPFSPGDTIEQLGAAIAKYVASVTARKPAGSKDSKTALTWLLGIGLGLLALSALAKED